MKEKSKFFVPFLLLLLCVVTYGQVLGHEFMMDDFDFWNQKGIPAFFPQFTDFFVKTYDQHYDPIYNLLNVSLFRLFREPWPLYLINLGLFYSNCLLLFYFIFQISKNFITALITACLFCVHPMSGEILQHLTLNIILLASSMMFLSLIFFYRYLILKSNVFFYVLSMFFLCLALLCHDETSMLFVFYAVSMAFILTKHSIKDVFKICAPFILIEALFFILWFIRVKTHASIFENFHSFHLFIWDFSANYFHLILWYIGNLFMPRNIVFMYNAAPVNDFIWLWNLLFLVSLSGMLVLVFYFKRSIEAFALMFFYSGFLIAIPAFGSRPYMGFIFEPNWLFFSSVGFYLFIAITFQKIKTKINRWLWVVLLPLLFMFLFIQTQRLNLSNTTQFNCCINWLRKSPGNVIPASILAQEYYITNRVKPSLELSGSMISVLDFYLQYNHYDVALKLISKLSPLDLSFDQRYSLLLRKARAYYESSKQVKSFGK